MSYKGPFTLRRNGLPEFFEEQLPLSVAVSTSAVVDLVEFPVRTLCLGSSVRSFDRPLLCSGKCLLQALSLALRR